LAAAPTQDDDTQMMSDSERSRSESESSEAGSDEEMQSDADGNADDGDHFGEDELAKSLEAELSARHSRSEAAIPETTTNSSSHTKGQNNVGAFQPVHRRSVSSNLQQDLLLSESSDED